MPNDEMSAYPVNMNMSGVALHADKSENLVYIAELLFRNGASAVIVRDSGIPAGIITSRDIIRALLDMGKSPVDIKASEIMSSPIVSIAHDAGLSEARNVMLMSGKKKIAVKKDYDVVGLLLERDLLSDMGWHNF